MTTRHLAGAFLCAVMAAVLLVGTGPVSAVEKSKEKVYGEISQDTALVYFVRSGMFAGKGLKYKLFSWDKFIAEIANDCYTFVEMKPGGHFVWSQAGQGDYWKFYQGFFTFEAGHTYYVDVTARNHPDMVLLGELGDEAEPHLQSFKHYCSTREKDRANYDAIAAREFPKLLSPYLGTYYHTMGVANLREALGYTQSGDVDRTRRSLESATEFLDKAASQFEGMATKQAKQIWRRKVGTIVAQVVAAVGAPVLAQQQAESFAEIAALRNAGTGTGMALVTYPQYEMDFASPREELAFYEHEATRLRTKAERSRKLLACHDQAEPGTFVELCWPTEDD